MPAPPSLDFKIAFLRELIAEFGSQPIRVLDFGCGTAKDWPSILRAYPSVAYTGIEPDDRSRDTARELLRGLPATVIAGWGEAATTQGGFDLTLSLSVLEHVKYLDRFLRASVNATRPGGTIVHRYDLGHALYPASSYERAGSSRSAAACRGWYRRRDLPPSWTRNMSSKCSVRSAYQTFARPTHRCIA